MHSIANYFTGNRNLCILSIMRRRLLFFVLLGSTLLAAQDRGERNERMQREQTGPAAVLMELIPITGDTSGTLIAALRMRYDLFSFSKSSLAQKDFTGSGDLTIEVLDSTGTSVARTIKTIELSSADNSLSALRVLNYQQLFSFPLPFGNYTLVLAIDPKDGGRPFRDRKRMIELKNDGTFRSGLIPVQPAAGTFPLFNYDGDVLFSQDFRLTVVSSRRFDSALVTITKRSMEDEEGIPYWTNRSVPLTVTPNASLHASTDTIALEPLPANGAFLLTAVIDGKQLKQGKYDVTMRFLDSSEVNGHFGARWPDMPLTLLDLDLATEPLQYITTKDEYSDLRKGGRENRIRKFEEFWKKKDPTPETAYNEMMHEFYRRADFSATAFRSLKEMNGAVTDRGKIYILYGKPGTTERLLSPSGAPKEIWTYPAQKKTFVFEDPGKQGNYKLTESK